VPETVSSGCNVVGALPGEKAILVTTPVPEELAADELELDVVDVVRAANCVVVAEASSHLPDEELSAAVAVAVGVAVGVAVEVAVGVDVGVGVGVDVGVGVAVGVAVGVEVGLDVGFEVGVGLDVDVGRDPLPDPAPELEDALPDPLLLEVLVELLLLAFIARVVVELVATSVKSACTVFAIVPLATVLVRYCTVAALFPVSSRTPAVTPAAITMMTRARIHQRRRTFFMQSLLHFDDWRATRSPGSARCIAHAPAGAPVWTPCG
jgi:hypothetical protein